MGLYYAQVFAMLGCAAVNACTSMDVLWLFVCSVCVYVHVWVSVHVEARGWCWESSFVTLHLVFVCA